MVTDCVEADEPTIPPIFELPFILLVFIQLDIVTFCVALFVIVPIIPPMLLFPVAVIALWFSQLLIVAPPSVEAIVPHIPPTLLLLQLMTPLFIHPLNTVPIWLLPKIPPECCPPVILPVFIQFVNVEKPLSQPVIPPISTFPLQFIVQFEVQLVKDSLKDAPQIPPISSFSLMLPFVMFMFLISPCDKLPNRHIELLLILHPCPSMFPLNEL